MRTVEAADAREWRAWLAAKHDAEREVWLVFFKPIANRTGVSHREALDEALCYGWIDSLVKRIDEERYAIKFTPRKPDSIWSDINRKRYAELKAAGRLERGGIERPPTGRRYKPSPGALRAVPRYIRDAVRKSPIAARHFAQLPQRERLRYATWVDTAKREETKAKRLQEALRLLAVGRVLGLK